MSAYPIQRKGNPEANQGCLLTEVWHTTCVATDNFTQMQHRFVSFFLLWSSQVFGKAMACNEWGWRLCCLLAKSLQSCLTLCDPIDSSPPGSPVPGILQAGTLEWAAISFSNVWKQKRESEVAQLCLTFRDAMDCSLPGSSVHGIFQARVLEWGATAFSRSLC